MVGVYTNFTSLFSFMKYNSSVFLYSNIIYFGQKLPIEVNFFELLSGRVKIHQVKILLSFLEPRVSFFKTLRHSSVL